MLALGFLTVILLGGIILSLPISSRTGNHTPFIDSLFTSTSAVCVTGLTTVTTKANFSNFGYIVIMSLIQFGGLGFMTWAVLVQLLMKKRISFYDRILIHEQMNEESFSGMVRLIIFVLKSTFLIESIGAVLLSFTFIPEFGLKKGIFYSIFHSVSAYCNAGFDILGEESLSKYSNSILVLLPIASLIILGGIGFNVFIDILKKKNYKKLRLHSKLVLTMTLILIVFPAIVIFLLEFNNPSTFMGKSLSYKSLSSFFNQSLLEQQVFLN